ncbi:hypothetical protein Tco_1541998 [Tanacetum coccineum]
MDIFTKGALWDYWKLGSDKIKPTNEETSDLEETNHNDEQEISEIFRIETNLFDYETPLCEKFKEFNYLLKIYPDLLTKDIKGFKTYDEYKDDWIYEWNENVPWWPTCSWKKDGYCNGGNLPGACIVGNTLRYKDLEWYDAVKDSELKEEALRNKGIMEGLIDEDDKSSNNGWRRWDGYEIIDHDQEETEYENKHIHTRSREAVVGMSWEDFKTLTKEEFYPVNEMLKLETELPRHGRGWPCFKARTLTDKAVRNGSLKKNPEKRGNGGEPNRDRNAKDENKRTRTGNAFATTTNLVRREYNGPIPKYVSYNLHHPPEIPCWACFIYGRLGHMAKDYRVAPRMVNPVNATNLTAASKACYECGGTNHFKATCLMRSS